MRALPTAALLLAATVARQPFRLAPGEVLEAELRPGEPAVIRVDAREPLVALCRSLWFDAELEARAADGRVLATASGGWYLDHPRLVLAGSPQAVFEIEVRARHGGCGPFRLELRAGEALRGAQLAMIERERRGEAGPTWGAFVLSGGWR